MNVVLQDHFQARYWKEQGFLQYQGSLFTIDQEACVLCFNSNPGSPFQSYLRTRQGNSLHTWSLSQEQIVRKAQLIEGLLCTRPTPYIKPFNFCHRPVRWMLVVSLPFYLWGKRHTETVYFVQDLKTNQSDGVRIRSQDVACQPTRYPLTLFFLPMYEERDMGYTVRRPGIGNIGMNSGSTT